MNGWMGWDEMGWNGWIDGWTGRKKKDRQTVMSKCLECIMCRQNYFNRMKTM